MMTHEKPLSQKELNQIENEMIQRQSDESVAEFLAAEKSGKATPSMMDASGAVGKGILILLSVVSLAGIFGQFARSVSGTEQQASAAQQVVVQKGTMTQSAAFQGASKTATFSP